MRWRLRATLDIHCAVFRVLMPVISAYVSALKAVWLHPKNPPQTRGAVPDEIVVDEPFTWADAMTAKPEHYTPYPEREQENWVNQTERLAAQPYPDDKLN